MTRDLLGDGEEYLTPDELSKRVGISVSRIRSLMDEDELEYVEMSEKMRLIKFSSWVDYIRRNTRGRYGQDALISVALRDSRL